MNFHAMLKANALAIAAGSFAVGVACTCAGLGGAYDKIIRYCDSYTNPCTPTQIPDWLGRPPQEAKFARVEPGTKPRRILAGLGAVVAYGIAITAALYALEQQRKRDEEKAIADTLDFIKAQLSLSEEAQRLQLAGDMRLKDFQALLMDGYAALLLERYPELIERFASKSAQPETSPASPTPPTAGEPTQTSHANDAPNEPIEQKPALPEGKDSEGSEAPPTSIQFSSPAPSIEPPHVLHESEAEAIKILDALAGSHRSLLLIGGTGAGKSVTECYLLTQLFRRNRMHETWAISQKNDSFCGLNKKGRVVLFDRKNIQDSFDVLNHVYGIYDKRRRLPEDKRKGLPPVRLILADWLSINQTLEEMKQDVIVKESEHRSKCADVVYNGRDMNVCLIVDLQSFNLAAVGLKADRNSRKNFNLVGLGNYYIEEDGSINESYGVVENMILDKNIVPDENERARLIETFRQLKPISKEHHRPILFTTLEPARVVLLPDLRAYKVGEIPLVQLDASAYTPQQLEKIYRLEFDIERKDNEPKSAEQDNNDTPGNSLNTQQLIKSELLRCFQEKGWVKIGSIRSDCKGLRKLTDDVNSDKPILSQLKSDAIIDMNEQTDDFFVIKIDS